MFVYLVSVGEIREFVLSDSPRKTGKNRHLWDPRQPVHIHHTRQRSCCAAFVTLNITEAADWASPTGLCTERSPRRLSRHMANPQHFSQSWQKNCILMLWRFSSSVMSNPGCQSAPGELSILQAGGCSNSEPEISNRLFCKSFASVSKSSKDNSLNVQPNRTHPNIVEKESTPFIIY